MNLHEECLLKYLLNPLDLWHSTELLKQNNSLLEKNTFKEQIFMQAQNAKCYSAN